jgi:hypothetical protein
MALKNPSVNCFRKFKRLQLTFQVVITHEEGRRPEDVEIFCRVHTPSTTWFVLLTAPRPVDTYRSRMGKAL